MARLEALPKLKAKWGDAICKARKAELGELTSEQQINVSLMEEYLLNEAMFELMPTFRAPCKWESKSMGKLFLTDYPSYHCCLAHSGEWVCIALSTMRVGLSASIMHPVPSRLAKKIMSEREFEQFTASTDKQADFFSCWTRKESYQILLGEGCYRPMPTFETTDKIFFEHTVDGCHLCLATYKTAIVRLKQIEP